MSRKPRKQYLPDNFTEGELKKMNVVNNGSEAIEAIDVNRRETLQATFDYCN